MQTDQTTPLNNLELGCGECNTSTAASGLPVIAPPTSDNGQLSGGNGNILTELKIALSTLGLTLDMCKYLTQKRFQHPTKMELEKGNIARQVHCSLQSHLLKVTTGVFAPQTGCYHLSKRPNCSPDTCGGRTSWLLRCTKGTSSRIRHIVLFPLLHLAIVLVTQNGSASPSSFPPVKPPHTLLSSPQS